MVLGFVLGTAVLALLASVAGSLARYAAEPGLGPSAAPIVVWTPPGAETSVISTIGAAAPDTGCSAAQEWRWTDATNRSWHAMARDCGDPDNASRWAAVLGPRKLLGAVLGFAQPPMEPVLSNGEVASVWSQGSLWLRVWHPVDAAPESVYTMARSLSQSVDRPINPNPDRYPIALASALAFLLMLTFQFTGRRWRATRGAIKGLSRSFEKRPEGQPSNYEDVDTIAPISRITIRLQQAADLVVLALATVVGVIAVRSWSWGAWWLTVLSVVVFVFALRGVMRIIGFGQGYSFLPLMPMPIESKSHRPIVLIGKSMRVGVHVVGYTAVGIVALLLAAIWLSVPAPRGFLLLAITNVRTDPIGIWQRLRYGAEAIVSFAPLLGLLLLVSAWLGLAVLWRLSERWTTTYAHERVAIPDLPPMLYLRSFDEDSLLTDQGDLAQGWVERLLARRRVRFEELMTRAAATLAPVDAVIDPRSAALTIGATRIIPSGDWQDSVRERAERALCVIVSATPDAVGEGFGWELKLLGRGLSHSRFCFVIGPWPVQERQRRLRAFIERANLDGVMLGMTPEMIPATTHIIAGTSSGDWMMAGSARSDAFSYAMSLQVAFASLAEKWVEEAAVATVPMSRQRRESLLITEDPPDVPWRLARGLFWLYRTFPVVGRSMGYYDE